jgi:hypothetical protein
MKIHRIIFVDEAKTYTKARELAGFLIPKTG